MAGLFSNISNFFSNIGSPRGRSNAQGQQLNLFGRPLGTGILEGQRPGNPAHNLGVRMGLVQHPLQGSTGTSGTPLNQQFSAMTGGLLPGTGDNLEALVRQNQPGVLNSQHHTVADSILRQFGVTSEQGFNATDYLTNGRLDLTRMPQNLLQGLDADARWRMRNANVLGSSLLTDLLPFSPPMPSNQSGLTTGVRPPLRAPAPTPLRVQPGKAGR